MKFTGFVLPAAAGFEIEWGQGSSFCFGQRSTSPRLKLSPLDEPDRFLAQGILDKAIGRAMHEFAHQYVNLGLNDFERRMRFFNRVVELCQELGVRVPDMREAS